MACIHNKFNYYSGDTIVIDIKDADGIVLADIKKVVLVHSSGVSYDITASKEDRGSSYRYTKDSSDMICGSYDFEVLYGSGYNRVYKAGIFNILRSSFGSN